MPLFIKFFKIPSVVARANSAKRKAISESKQWRYKT